MKERSEFVFDARRIRDAGGHKAALAPDPALFADAFASPGALKKLEVELAFSVADEELLLDGKVTAELALECSRCAAPLTRSFSDSFDEQYGYSVEYIDTRELIREAAALLEPMKVLCSEACKGRCPECGADLNKKTCSCDRGRAPHFDALKDFKVRKNDKGS